MEKFLADEVIHADVVEVVSADKTGLLRLNSNGTVGNRDGCAFHGDVSGNRLAQTVAGGDQSAGAGIDRKRAEVGAVENDDVLFALIAEYVGLGSDVILHRHVVVKVFLIEIEYHADMGGVPDEFQLVTAHFKDNGCVVIHLVDVIEAGNPDIADKDGVVVVVFQQVVEQGGGSALALGAGNAEGVFAERGQKHFCLGGQPVDDVFGMKDGNTGTFEDIVEAVEVGSLCFRVPEPTVRIRGHVDLLGIGKRQRHLRIDRADVMEGGNTFPSHAPDHDVLILNKGDDILHAVQPFLRL